MKSIGKTLLYCVISILGAVVVGCILMLMVYSLPTGHIRKNLEKSIDIFKTEDDNYYWAYWIASSHLDNFTDSIMLSNALYDGDESTTDKAMLNPRIEYNGCTRSESLVRNLETEAENDGTYTEYYARYWHGYLVLLKPFLILFTFSDWRMCSMIFQIILLCIVLYKIEKNINEKIAFCYLISMIAMNPISSALSMQYACIYNITLIGSLILLTVKKNNHSDIWKLTLWIGIATAFLDFLTFPVIPIGMVLLLYLSMNKNESNKDKMFSVIKSSVVWCIGYGLMWSGKWISVSLLTGQNIVFDSIKNVASRMYGDPYAEAQLTSLNVFYVIAKNIHKYVNAPFIILGLALFIIGIYIVFIKKNHFVIRQSNLILLFVGLYPVFWYSIVRNHSAIHSWMVHRDLSVMIFAVLAFFCESIVEWQNNRRVIE